MRYATIFMLLFLACNSASPGDDDEATFSDDDTEAVSDNDDSEHGDDDAEAWSVPIYGLIWEVNSETIEKTIANGELYCDILQLGGFNDWRLPTISELRTLITGCANTETSGICRVSDGCAYESCNDGACAPCEENCYAPTELKNGCDIFMSQTVVPVVDSYNWCVDFATGSFVKCRESKARCVRRSA